MTNLLLKVIERNTRSNNDRIANKKIFRNHSPYWKMQLPRVERSIGSIVDHIQADAWLDVHVCDSFSSHLYFYAQLAGPGIIYIWTSFRFIFTRIIFPKVASYRKSEYGVWVIVKYSNSPPWNHEPGPVFCLLLGVSSDYAEVTCPVIDWAQPELTRSKR